MTDEGFDKLVSNKPRYYTTSQMALMRNAYKAGREEILDIIRDMAVVDWMYTETNKDDAKAMINDMICYNNQIALDPCVSKEAEVKLDVYIAQESEGKAIQRAEQAEAALVIAREGLEKIINLQQNSRETWYEVAAQTLKKMKREQS